MFYFTEGYWFMRNKTGISVELKRLIKNNSL